MGFQKPNGLKYNDIIDEYGTALIKDSEFWSDISLLPLVKCQYIRERIRDSLSSLQTSGSAFNALPFQAEMNVQAFHNEVEEWKRTVPEGIKSMRISSPNNTYLFFFLTQSHRSHDPRRAFPNHQRLQPRPRLLPPHPRAARATSKPRNTIPLSRSLQEVLRIPALHPGTPIPCIHKRRMEQHHPINHHPVPTLLPASPMSGLGCCSGTRTRSSGDVPRLLMLPHASPLLGSAHRVKPKSPRRALHLQDGAREHQKVV
jgi:hypothetical protein